MRFIVAMLVLGLLSPLFALMNVTSCTDLNVSNEVYNLTADIGCTGACTCININASNVTLQCNGFTIDWNRTMIVSSYGINLTSVENTTVKDCYITDFTTNIRIALSRFSNITNNSIVTNDNGIYLTADSDNNTLEGNSFTGDYCPDGCTGMVVNGSSNFNLLSGNSVTGIWRGIRIDAPDNNITNNDLRNNEHALMVMGSPTVPCRNYVDSSNQAGDSGDPIYFVYDSSGETIENSASYGEVLLCNVSNSVIRNITMDDDDGIVLSSYSNNNQIYNNNINGAYNGYYIYLSSGNTLYNNSVSSGNYGFYVRSSENNVICNNTLTSNGVGLHIVSSSFNRFCNAQISAVFGGAIIERSSNNTVQNITVNPAPIYGILLSKDSYNNSVSNLTANVTASWGLGGIVTPSISDTPSAENVFTDTIIYSAVPSGINDYDGGETFINTYIYSTTNTFIAASTAPSSFTNLTLAKDGSTVNFLGTFSMSNTSNSSNTNIASDFVSIDTSTVPELNQSAIISTYTSGCPAAVFSLAGFPSSRSSILSGGSECLLCSILSCAGNAIQFDVPEFTGYAATQQTYLTLSINDTSPVTYGTPINISCNASNSEVLLSLYANDTLLNQGYSYIDFIGLLAAGEYNITCNATATENYTSAEASELFQIDKATTSITLFNATPASPITYGTETNVSCAVDNPQVILTIFQNGSPVMSGTTAIEYLASLPAGSYEFICNTSGNENYTGATGTISPYIVGKADPSSSVIFTAAPGWSVTTGQTVNISCNTSNPEITLELWNSTGMIGSGQNILYSGTFPAGTYGFTCNSSETENYTAYSQSNTLTVTSPPSGGGGGREETALLIVAPDEVPTGTQMLIVVTREDDATLSGVRVIIRLGSTVVFDDYTDTWGRVFFTPTETGTYTIEASRTGFTDAEDEFEAVQPVECASNDDCLESEVCREGLCAPIPAGECGYYSNHAWVDYACCSDSDCPEGQACRDHQCAIVEEEPEEKCTSDTDCAPGYACSAGSCILAPRAECATKMDCLPGYDCREGTCVKEPPEVPIEEELPSEEVAGEERPGPAEQFASAIAGFTWPLLLAVLILFVLFLLWKRRKKKEPSGAEKP